MNAPDVATTSAPPRQGQAGSSPAVELVGVTKRFDDVIAVDNVNLRINDGEFFSLLGPSGCGKTTTLRMIAGLEFPTHGSIRIHDEQMSLRPPNKRPVNTVFQSYALFPHMSVRDNIAFGLQMKKVDRHTIGSRVTEAVQLVRLGGMEHRRPKQLSGGQQQRVALARALVNHPQVLLLDEPLGALDLKLRKAMQLELKELQERVGITFVYVTHDQEEALTMSDRIGVMDDGRLLQVGTPEEIYERPATRMVADFIGETNFLPIVVTELDRARIEGGQEIIIGGDGTPGTKTTLTIRPEKMRITAPREPVPEGDNQLLGTLHRRVYLGNALALEVTAGAVRLRVRQGSAAQVHRFRDGDEVAVLWSPADAAVLED
ncbi:MAG: polyamine ABC transporter ATP-binding protein [Nitriliruptorales bacterium]|nr:polyamine ABC transporter ATP-binding protein [Nitriliruptorales bacterium]